VELRAGDVPVAASLNFLCRGWWSSYMKGFDPAWSHSRPGTVLDAVRIREAIAEHATHFDFGRGDEAYKSGFGVTMRQTTRVLLVNPTPRSQLAYALLVLRRQVRKRLARPGPAPAEPALELVPPRAPAD
jgi:CelD/BcsL family acetyltransferase involved in cellulose biosynthesis